MNEANDLFPAGIDTVSLNYNEPIIVCLFVKIRLNVHLVTYTDKFMCCVGMKPSPKQPIFLPRSSESLYQGYL